MMVHVKIKSVFAYNCMRVYVCVCVTVCVCVCVCVLK